MAKSEWSFVYQPLNLASDEIRLIKLLPWKPTKLWTTVECEIFKAPLNLAPHYEYLSYTWGDAFSTQRIRVDARSMVVRQNLFEALMDLRTGQSRILWIDAICIDQSNIPERNHQVQRMRHIYENATGVLVWLGALHSRISTVEGIHFLDWVQRKYEQLRLLPVQSLEPHSLDSAFTKLSIEKTLQSSLREIFMKPWWRRVWIIQEIVCAKVATVHLGESSTSWESLMWMSRQLSHNDTASELENQRLAKVQNSGESLFDLTRRFRTSEATDQRDKVYALVGLAKSSKAGGESPDTKLHIPG
jgi:hypothetical protein